MVFVRGGRKSRELFPTKNPKPQNRLRKERKERFELTSCLHLGLFQDNPVTTTSTITTVSVNRNRIWDVGVEVEKLHHLS